MGRIVDIDQLGSGTARWARLAISLALTGGPPETVPATLVVDEPERALHPAAQQQVAHALGNFDPEHEFWDSVVPIASIIVASHSPAFLAQPGARLIHVSRHTQGDVALSAIDTTAGVEGLVAQLGIARSDALLMTQTFVFVEGEHDLAMLMGRYADVLRDRRAVVQPMRGAKNVESYVLAEQILAYSDARIRVVLDRVGSPVTRQWSDARRAWDRGNAPLARRLIDKLGTRSDRESQWLCQAGLAAVNRGTLSRIDVVGLDRPDIINYLPVAEFVPDASSWKDLFDEWRAVGKPGPDFKLWLKNSKGAQINSARIRHLAARITDIGDLDRVVDGL